MNNQQAGNEKRREQAAHLWAGRKDEIVWLYCHLEWSQHSIAKYYDVSQPCLHGAMKRLGIPSRSKANHGSKNGRYKDGSQGRGYRVLVEKDKCRACGSTEKLGVHHKNNDHYDNRIDNLEILCNSCHMSETKKRWWEAKKAGLPTPKSNAPIGWK